MTNLAVPLVLLALTTGMAWAITFHSRQARTARMVAVAVLLTCVAWAFAPGVVVGVPGPVRGLVTAVCAVVWYAALRNGERIGLFALTPDENRLNEALRRVSQRAGIIGPDDDPAKRPERLPELLVELDSLDPPDARWARVVRLTREYLLALPADHPVPQRDLLEFLMWRRTWFDTHDRRILFAERPDPRRDFEADLRMDHNAFLRALSEGDRAAAAGVLEALVARRAPAEGLGRVRDRLAAALRSRLAAVTAGQDPDQDPDVAAADTALRDAWSAM